MIFSENLDNSLVKILETDKNIRRDLLNFLDNIPEEIIDSIKSVDLNILDDEEDSINVPDAIADATIFKCNLYKEDEKEALYIKEELATPGDIPHMNFIKELYLVSSGHNNQGYLGSFSLSIAMVGTFDSTYIPIEGFTPIAKSLNGNGKVFGYIKEICYMYDELYVGKRFIKITNSVNDEKRLIKLDIDLKDFTLAELNERYDEGFTRRLEK